MVFSASREEEEDLRVGAFGAWLDYTRPRGSNMAANLLMVDRVILAAREQGPLHRDSTSYLGRTESVDLSGRRPKFGMVSSDR